MKTIEIMTTLTVAGIEPADLAGRRRLHTMRRCCRAGAD
jgi:hypothetical protein